MESAQNIKRHLASVRNIGQITKAMELVAATKMRRSQELALNSRPYTYAAIQLLGTLSQIDVSDKKSALPDILTGRPIVKITFLIMTSDKGLAGSFNSAVIKRFENYVKSHDIDVHDPNYSFVAIGQKAKVYLERKGLKIMASFNRVGDYTKLAEAESIADFIIKGYVSHAFDSAKMFSTVLVTALQQDAVIRDLFPISRANIKAFLEDMLPRAGKYSDYIDQEKLTKDRGTDYLIEPSISEALEELTPELMKVMIYQQILEANASEHSARRVAMKNASDNASDLSSDLEIEYNKSRQAAITRELIEVTSGAQSSQ
ncbi:MAG: ATP synthase F1 subunit gamma [Patescibacteria group bacterium]|nr:ATP synthase F1 subunit gamma [Patescibacteria group bacterium]MCL5224075.1 ATP synthase F1 subunit gamma [Patescibacteria group bacterium]